MAIAYKWQRAAVQRGVPAQLLDDLGARPGGRPAILGIQPDVCALHEIGDAFSLAISLGDNQ